MAVIGSLVAQLTLDAAAFVRDLNQAGESLDKAGRRMATVGRNISTYISAPIAGLGALVLKTSSEFETGMNKLESVSGATGAELSKLREEAKKLGAQIEFGKFSALDAAEGMTDLAQAGFKTNEIITAMPGLLQLATASQMELGDAAETVSSILRGYGKDVTELAHVNDVLTKASIETNAELNTLGEAMKFVGPVASSAGLQFEEIAAAVGKLSDAGIQGEMAGTALRGAITQLLSPTDTATSLLDLYGVSVTDAVGRMRSLTEIVADFEANATATQGTLRGFVEEMGSVDQAAFVFSEHFALAAEEMVEVGKEVKKSDLVAVAEQVAKGMGIAGEQSLGLAEALQRSWKATGETFISGSGEIEAFSGTVQKLFAGLQEQGVLTGDLMEIFGQRAGPGMAALIQQGAGALGDLTTTLENSGGTAAQVASTQLQGFGAAMEGLKSSFEGLQIAIGDSGLLEFATMLVGKLAGFVEALGKLDPAVLKFASILAAAVAAGGPLLLMLGGMAVALGALLTPVGLVVAAIVGTAGIVGAIVAFREEIGGAVLGAIQGLSDAFVAMKDNALDAVESMVSGIEDALGRRMKAVLQTSALPTVGVALKFKEMYNAVVGQSYVPDMVDGIEREFKRLRAIMVNPAGAATADVEKQFADLQAKIDELQTETAGGAGGFSTVQQESLLAEPFKNALRDVQSSFTDTFREIFSGGVTTFSDIADQAEKIFIDLAANLATTAIFNPQSIAGLLGAAGGPGTPGAAGEQPGELGLLGGALGAGAIGFAGGTVAGGFFGGQGQLGGGIGGALGAAGGFALGGPVGALAGGVLGGVGGGLLGSLFGGGNKDDKSKGSVSGSLGQLSARGANLGEITGALRKFDDSILQLLTKRQKELVDASLRARKSAVEVNFKGELTEDVIRSATGQRARAIGTGLGFRNIQNAEDIGAALQTQRAIEELTNSTALFARQIEETSAQFVELRSQGRQFGISIEGLAEAQTKAVADLRKAQDAQIAALLDPFKALLAPLDAFKSRLDFTGLNPAEQFARAQADFQRISADAAAGSIPAIQQFESAADLFVQLANQVGASPGQAAAVSQVEAALSEIRDSITAAQADASRGVEDILDRADRNNTQRLDQLIELIQEEIRVLKKGGSKI